MAYKHLTASGSTGSNVSQGPSRKVILTNNLGVTGVITVSDETGTAGTPVVAIITNPVAGQQYEYWNMKTGLTVQSTVNFDMTANTDSSQGGNQ